MSINTEIMESSKIKDKKIKNLNTKYALDRIMKYIFLVSATISIISLVVITGFVFYKGSKPFLTEGYSIISFLTGTEWVPSSKLFGIAPMIIASLLATFGSIVIGTSIGILTAIFIAEIAPKKLSSKISSAVELLAGIPSVLYGMFGLAVIVPSIQSIFNLPKGQSLLAVILVLSIMMLPTIVSVSETAIRSVDNAYKEGSYALGASKIETIFKVILPAAKSGILAAVVLGIGRALGETMAVILVAGNSPTIPTSITDSVRPLTTNIALEMGYAYGTHQEMLFATGVVLFIFILVLNIVLNKITKKAVK
ncbi:phosphate ABC transporter permease subunit PstC [Peptacetobacter sp.]|uniref:phosphate ABC transporter permease subunit PstC n=1 Tax=Peptacetobacter sp. TaxID=2991975 RepID=UPI002627C0A1|nr:phosphate ABC transporter permease subunit PstC [Peptacetobacter sp.]